MLRLYGVKEAFLAQLAQAAQALPGQVRPPQADEYKRYE